MTDRWTVVICPHERIDASTTILVNIIDCIVRTIFLYILDSKFINVCFIFKALDCSNWEENFTDCKAWSSNKDIDAAKR